MIFWIRRLVEAEAIYRQAPRSKGVLNWAQNRLGRPAWSYWPGPISTQYGPGFLPVASRTITHLCALACGPLTSFPSLLRLECLPSKLPYFLVESLNICTLTLWSSGHLESCSSRVLTLVGLHDLLPKCLMNVSRKSPL